MIYSFQEMKQRIKFGLQRMFRGYDDTAHWNLDSYIANIVVPVLERYKTYKCGMMSNHSYKGEDPFRNGWHTTESQNALFDDIIFAMKNSIDDLEHKKEVLGKDYTKKDMLEYDKRVSKGLKLFAEYFNGLWT